MNTQRKLGLVLSGGGRKGAFQVGVVKAISKLKLKPSVFAGASIGALNGAILAASPSLDESAKKLELLWLGDNHNAHLQLNPHMPYYAGLAALNLIIGRVLPQQNSLFSIKDFLSIGIGNILHSEELKHFGLLDSTPVRTLIKNSIDFDYLLSSSAPDFFVSVFPASENTGFTYFDDIIIDFWRYFTSKDSSTFLRLKDYDIDNAINIVFASASIPFIFPSAKVEGNYYRDGGLGKRLEDQGNVPASALIQAGCSHAIVAITSLNSLWNRFEYPELEAIEIRPSIPLDGANMIQSLLDFDANTLRWMIDLGEKDTLQIISDLALTFQELATFYASRDKLKNSLTTLIKEDETFEKAYRNLRNIEDDEELT